LSRNFDTSLPNQKWVTDITEFSIPAGKVYLSPIVDCFDGGTPSWSIGTSPNAELVNTMLNTAADTLSESERPIIHSDRGAHYRWPEWIGLINQYGFTRSMSKKSSTPDNAQAESFFRPFKDRVLLQPKLAGKVGAGFYERT
jgi:putative transposase